MPGGPQAGRLPPFSILGGQRNSPYRLGSFEFDGQIWQQIRGTAMGTRMAQSYAGLFMGALERTLLEGAAVKPLVWLRYINDIYLVWSGSRESLEG